MHYDKSHVETETMDERDYFANLADRVRAEGLRALDGLEIDEPLEEYATALLDEFPAEDAA